MFPATCEQHGSVRVPKIGERAGGASATLGAPARGARRADQHGRRERVYLVISTLIRKAKRLRWPRQKTTRYSYSQDATRVSSNSRVLELQ